MRTRPPRTQKQLLKKAAAERAANEAAGDPISVTTVIQDTDALVVATFDAATDSYNITANGATVTDVLGRGASKDVGDLTAYEGARTLLFGQLGTSEKTGVLLVADDYDAGAITTGQTNFVNAQFYRQATTVPTVGSATFTGDYAGVWRETDSSTAPGNMVCYVDGTATLTASFAGKTIEGRLESRELIRIRNDIVANALTTTTLTDVVLNATSLTDNRLFSGTTTGGGQADLGATETSGIAGAYQGAIGGDAGEEVVGSVEINQTRDDDARSWTETGVFAAQE